jgi:hypothetical protein
MVNGVATRRVNDLVTTYIDIGLWHTSILDCGCSAKADGAKMRNRGGVLEGQDDFDEFRLRALREGLGEGAGVTDHTSSGPPSGAGPVSPPAPSSGPTPEQRESLTDFVHARLTKALGPVRAGEVLSSTLLRMGCKAIASPQDLLEFSEHLIRQGGLVQAVGRSFKVKALLRGAVEAA